MRAPPLCGGASRRRPATGGSASSSWSGGVGIRRGASNEAQEWQRPPPTRYSGRGPDGIHFRPFGADSGQVFEGGIRKKLATLATLAALPPPGPQIDPETNPPTPVPIISFHHPSP